MPCSKLNQLLTFSGEKINQAPLLLKFVRRIKNVGTIKIGIIYFKHYIYKKGVLPLELISKQIPKYWITKCTRQTF